MTSTEEPVVDGRRAEKRHVDNQQASVPPKKVAKHGNASDSAGGEDKALGELAGKAGIITEDEFKAFSSSITTLVDNKEGIPSVQSLAYHIMFQEDENDDKLKTKYVSEPSFGNELWEYIQQRRQPANVGPLLWKIYQAWVATGNKGCRDDWYTEPRNVVTRDKLDPTIGKVVGLGEMPGQMKALFRDKDAFGMLNAVSGAGKTTALLYCEQTLNEDKDEDNPIALMITFHRGDGRSLTAEQGLAMRFAERFFMKKDCLQQFRKMWIKSPELKNIGFAPLIYEIYVLCGKKKLMLLIDEPGLAGSDKRPPQEEEANPARLPKVAEKVVHLTGPMRGNDQHSVLANKCSGDELTEFCKNVRVLFASLTPVFKEKDLENMTRAAGPIRWIQLPEADQHDHLPKLVRSACQGFNLHKRMSKQQFEDAIELLVALSSGHWATMDSLINTAKQGVVGVPRGWLKTMHLKVLQDALVSVEGVASDSRMRDANMRELLMFAVLGKKVTPFKRHWKSGEDGETVESTKRNLVDLAHSRVVLNRFPVEANTFQDVVPRLCLLDVRKWCCSDDVAGDDFASLVRCVLQIAGNDPSDPETSVESCNYGKAFEKTAGHFLTARLYSWYEIDSQHPYFLGRLANANKYGFSNDRIFPGHTLACGKNMMFDPPTEPPRILQIKGTGGFHNKKDKPEWPGEALDSWLEEAHAKLEFEGGEIEKLRPYDQVIPGSKIQPHSDRLLVTKVRGGPIGLAFIQDNFSEKEAPTVLAASHVTQGLEKLLAERGVLFGVANGKGEGPGPANQIAKLGVQEKDVVYCWSVLRHLPKNTNAFFNDIKKYAESKAFKGSVLVATGNKMYGDTFGSLALVYAGAKQAR